MNDGRDKNDGDEEKKRMTWGRLRLVILVIVKERRKGDKWKEDRMKVGDDKTLVTSDRHTTTNHH